MGIQIALWALSKMNLELITCLIPKLEPAGLHSAAFQEKKEQSARSASPPVEATVVLVEDYNILVVAVGFVVDASETAALLASAYFHRRPFVADLVAFVVERALVVLLVVPVEGVGNVLVGPWVRLAASLAPFLPATAEREDFLEAVEVVVHLRPPSFAWVNADIEAAFATFAYLETQCTDGQEPECTLRGPFHSRCLDLGMSVVGHSPEDPSAPHLEIGIVRG
jgi:hypothetical protein